MQNIFTLMGKQSSSIWWDTCIKWFIQCMIFVKITLKLFFKRNKKIMQSMDWCVHNRPVIYFHNKLLFTSPKNSQLQKWTLSLLYLYLYLVNNIIYILHYHFEVVIYAFDVLLPWALHSWNRTVGEADRSRSLCILFDFIHLRQYFLAEIRNNWEPSAQWSTSIFICFLISTLFLPTKYSIDFLLESNIYLPIRTNVCNNFKSQKNLSTSSRLTYFVFLFPFL